MFNKVKNIGFSKEFEGINSKKRQLFGKEE